MLRQDIQLKLEAYYNGKISFYDAIEYLMISKESFYIFRGWMGDFIKDKISLFQISDMIYSHIQNALKEFYDND